MTFELYETTCDRLRREHATMLATLTATQKRCTEQEQRIRDQERELVELRGRQGAEILHDEPPRFEVRVDDSYHSAHDTKDRAFTVAKQASEWISKGTVTVVEIRSEFTVKPAQDRSVTVKHFGPNCLED